MLPLAIDLLLAAGIFLLLVWLGEKLLVGVTGMVRGGLYSVLLIGVTGLYFALFRRLKKPSPGNRLGKWGRTNRQVADIRSSGSFPGK